MQIAEFQVATNSFRLSEKDGMGGFFLLFFCWVALKKGFCGGGR